MSASLIFYGSLFLALVFAKLGHHAPSLGVVSVVWLGVAYRYCRTPGWPASGELSAASIFAILIVVGLPSALGLVG